MTIHLQTQSVIAFLMIQTS